MIKSGIILILLIVGLFQQKVYAQEAAAQGVLSVFEMADPFIPAIGTSHGLGVIAAQEQMSALKKASYQVLKFRAVLDNIQEKMAWLEEVKRHKTNLDKMYKSSQKMAKSLKTLFGTGDITANDALLSAKMLTGLDLNPNSYIPNVSFTKSLKKDIKEGLGSGQASREFMNAYKSLEREAGGFSDVANEYNYVRKKREKDRELKNLKTGFEVSIQDVGADAYTWNLKQIEMKMAKIETYRRLAKDPKVDLKALERIRLNEKANQLVLEIIDHRIATIKSIKDIMSYKNTPELKALSKFNNAEESRDLLRTMFFYSQYK